MGIYCLFIEIWCNPALRPPRKNSHPVITATLFVCPAETPIHFLVKKPSLIRSPLVIMANFFWPLGDRNNGVPQ